LYRFKSVTEIPNGMRHLLILYVPQSAPVVRIIRTKYVDCYPKWPRIFGSDFMSDSRQFCHARTCSTDREKACIGSSNSIKWFRQNSYISPRFISLGEKGKANVGISSSSVSG
jgi:hypothetical protein